MTEDPRELHEIEIGAYDESLVLNRYNGKIFIVSARRNAAGQKRFRMAYPKMKDGPGERAIPLQVCLGQPKQAVGILRQFLDAIQRDGGAR
jgi:hypothetical protein